MILKRITPKNIDRLDWFDTVYILENPIKNPNETPKISQILSFSDVENESYLLDGNYYCSNMVWYNFDK
jgi:hypothetical protein